MYILKYYIRSKYFGYSRINYKEFEYFSDLESFINYNNIKIYEIYERVG